MRALIFEDKVEEQRYAVGALHDMGIGDFSVHPTFDVDAAQRIAQGKYDIVLSDLFFPGGEQSERLKNILVAGLEARKARKFTPIENHTQSPVYRAINVVADALGTDQQGMIDWFYRRGEWHPRMRLEDTIHGVTNYAQIEDFERKVQEAREGRHIPSGIGVANVCNMSRVPLIIVTDTYHHSDMFEAISGDLRASYVDTTVEEDGIVHKDWSKGLERVLETYRSGESYYWGK